MKENIEESSNEKRVTFQDEYYKLYIINQKIVQTPTH